MNSGLRHVLKTRSYRERSQPAARAHLGLLEKKKDYKLRAKDFHKKEDAIRKLKEKAAFRNPDEFYFKMNNTKTEDGVHRKQAAEQPTADDMKQFKREDSGYLMVKQTAEAKKIERLRASLHMLDAPLQNKHTIFVDNAASARGIDMSARGATPAELASSKPLRRGAGGGAGPSSSSASTMEDEVDGEDGSVAAPPPGAPAGSSQLSKKAMAKLERERAAHYEEFQQRTARHDKMARTLQRIGIEKALLGKGPRRKIKATVEGIVKKVHKWRQRRQK